MCLYGMVDDGLMAYYKVHQIVKANTCNRLLPKPGRNTPKTPLSLIKVYLFPVASF